MTALLPFLIPALLGVIFFPAILMTFSWGNRFYALQQDKKTKKFYFLIAAGVILLMAGILALLYFVLQINIDSILFKIISGLFIGVLFALLPRKTGD